MSSTWGSK